MLSLGHFDASKGKKMKLWTKTIIMSVAMMVSIAAILIVSSNLVFSRNFTDIEVEQATKDAERVQTIVQARLDALTLYALDWAVWDDSYQFVADGNQAYIDANLGAQTFLLLQTNVMAYTDNTGNLVWARSFDLNTTEDAAISSDLQQYLMGVGIAASTYSAGGMQGILRLDEGPMLFAAQPILTSTGEGPARGFLFIGRYMDAWLLNELATTSQTSLSLNVLTTVPGEPVVSNLENPTDIQMTSDTITASIVLLDADGNPYLRIDTTTPCDVYREGLMVIGWYNTCIIVAIVGISLLGLRVVKSWILKRFNMVETSVADIASQKDFSMRVPVSGQDLEMGRLSGAINSLLDSLCAAQAAVQESEAKYSTIVENMSDGVVIVEDGVHKYINKRVTEIQGLSYEQILGKPFFEWVAPESRAAMLDIYNARIAGQDVPDWYQTKIIHGDGHIFTVELSAKVVELNGKKNDIVVLHDITERCKMEQALRDSEARYRLLADNSEDVIWLLDVNTMSFTYASPSLQRMCGYSPEEFYCLGWDKILTPESCISIFARIQKEVTAFNNKESAPKAETETLWQMRKDGSLVPIEVVASIVPDEHGKAKQILGVTRNITERKKAEELLNFHASILHNVHDGIMVLDTDRQIIYWNDGMTSILEYSAEEMFGKNPEGLSLFLTAEKMSDILKIITQRHDYTTEWECRTKSGKTAWVATTIAMMKDRSGQRSGAIIMAKDITASKMMQAELRSKTAFLEAQLNATADGVLVSDDAGRVILENPACSRLWGFSHRELAFTNIEKRMQYLSTKVKYPEEFSHKFRDMMSRHDARLKDELELADGTVMERYSAPVLGEDGGYYGRIWHFHDITDRKRDEIRLRESEERYRLLADNSNDVIWTMSLDGHFTYASPSVYQLLGYTPDETLHKRIEDMVCPASLGIIRQDFTKALQETQKGIKYTAQYFEVEQPCKDGSTVWTEATANLLLNQDNQPVGIVGVSRNITQRKKAEQKLKESEQRLSEIIDFLPDATVVININKEIISWNRAMEELTGVKAGEMLGKDDYEHSLPFYGKRCPMLIDLLMQPEAESEKRYAGLERIGDMIYGEAFMPHLADGNVYLYGTASLLRSSTGDVLGAIESIRNITERKKSEDLIKSSLKEKETLLKEIQHRVKNNMQVVSSLLELQSSYVKDEEDAHMFRESQDRIKAMALVYNKLYKSKDLANINMREYFTELAENLIFSYKLGGYKIETKIDIDNIVLGLDLVVPCGLVLNEIVVNSLKYAFVDGRRGLICIGAHKTEDDDIEILISDNGVGLPENILDVNRRPTLGMELVHALAEQQLGGRVEVTGTNGTAYRITFNAGKAPAQKNG